MAERELMCMFPRLIFFGGENRFSQDPYPDELCDDDDRFRLGPMNHMVHGAFLPFGSGRLRLWQQNSLNQA